jgi:hypothetical protein
MGNSQTTPYSLDQLQLLVGRWVGVYGPHGLEVIDVKIDQGKLVATKITGDVNVPAGQITFEVEPHGLARGRVAEVGFVNPLWIPGRLEWNGEDADEFAFRWHGCGSVEYIRVNKDFALTRENVRTFLAQNYTRFIHYGDFYVYIGRDERKRGAKKKDIDVLPKSSYHKSDETNRCTICLTDFEENEEITFLPCGHYFHTPCITKWLQLRDACPLCQKSITSNNNANTMHNDTTKQQASSETLSDSKTNLN